jgi:hypothetical protein
VLEEFFSRMWREGWDPATSDVNLFVRDLGSVFMSMILTMAGGEPVFRSMTDLSHASLWWKKNRLEVFPFHKTYRRLTDQAASRWSSSLIASQEAHHIAHPPGWIAKTRTHR